MKIVFPGKQGQEKTSNARGMPGKGGGGMLKLRFDWYIMFIFKGKIQVTMLNKIFCRTFIL